MTATTASIVPGNTLWALTDHLGSVRDLVDNNGVIREHNVYDSFGRLVREVDYNAAGQVIASTDPAAVDTLFGYTGRLFDPHTSLQYNRARWYDAATGRWLNQDPIGFAAGDMNLYRYVGNGPTSATDPSGLREFEVVIHYYFTTLNVNDAVKKEVQRILDDALARHGKKGDTIKVTFVKLESKDAYDQQECGIEYSSGFLGLGKTAIKVNVTLWENPNLESIGFGNGLRFDGSLVPLRVFREKLIELRKRELVDEAIASAIVHEGIYHGLHGLTVGHDTKTGFVDSEKPTIDKKQQLSDEACKKILGKFDLAK